MNNTRRTVGKIALWSAVAVAALGFILLGWYVSSKTAASLFSNLPIVRDLQPQRLHARCADSERLPVRCTTADIHESYDSEALCEVLAFEQWKQTSFYNITAYNENTCIIITYSSPGDIIVYENDTAVASNIGLVRCLYTLPKGTYQNLLSLLSNE